jgi:hypothetical protein
LRSPDRLGLQRNRTSATYRCAETRSALGYLSGSALPGSGRGDGTTWPRIQREFRTSARRSTASPPLANNIFLAKVTYSLQPASARTTVPGGGPESPAHGRRRSSRRRIGRAPEARSGVALESQRPQTRAFVTPGASRAHAKPHARFYRASTTFCDDLRPSGPVSRTRSTPFFANMRSSPRPPVDAWAGLADLVQRFLPGGPWIVDEISPGRPSGS